VFAIQVPAWTALQSPVKVSAQAPPGAQRLLRIGLVEDNAELRQAMVLALESLGHTVVAAENGKKLLQHLANTGPDVLVSDFQLVGGETGFQVIDAARKAFGADLPAIIVTADTDPTIIRSMVDRGIAVHFKPLQIATLQAFILQATERKAP
jgi:CheY-like chemotaxis protein